MPRRFCFVLLALWALAASGCRPEGPPPVAPPAASLRARCLDLIYTGDSIYAQKSSYQSFTRALVYYDSAQALAEHSPDTLLRAEAVFAKGRVYDAWNKEPAQTIACFRQAAALFAHLPGQQARAFYARFLVAHAYDKVPDSLRTVQELRGLRRDLLRAPAALRRWGLGVEMALSSTEVHNYALADSLLRQLVPRAAVRNDPATYNYLDHYYLTQARLDVLYRRRRPAPYLDSLQGVCARAPSVFDRQYYSHHLAQLAAAAGRWPLAYTYLALDKHLTDSLSNNDGSARTRQALVATEQQAAQRRQQFEAGERAGRRRTIWLLTGSLVVITLLSGYLARQSRRAERQAAHLAGLNEKLDEKVAQVELLNKEIQHRVKNNLHMIFSLLHMQERRTDNEEVVAQLQAARLRVESIAALHNQLLHQPEGLDLSAYLRTLIATVVACLANDRQVVTHLSTDPLDLPPNHYFALSLILNEWVTNSIKYAPTGTGPLEISVQVRRRAHDILLTYTDNGRPAADPAPDPAADPAAGGLGTQIIALLTRQLGATLTTAPAQPYHYHLSLPPRDAARP